MNTQRATRDSWRNQPMPESKTRLLLEQAFSAEEYERIGRGLIPAEMEDKWFIYLEGGWLYFHRSWTGVCIYQLHLKPAEEGYRIVEAWANRDPQQYKNTDDDYDVALLTCL